NNEGSDSPSYQSHAPSYNNTAAVPSSSDVQEHADDLPFYKKIFKYFRLGQLPGLSFFILNNSKKSWCWQCSSTFIIESLYNLQQDSTKYLDAGSLENLDSNKHLTLRHMHF